MLLFIDFFTMSLFVKSCFNTSHVTLYLFDGIKSTEHLFRFNTSHVTLYRRWTGIMMIRSIVSIHLMLLFIHERQWRCNRQKRFNTSHVTLYRLENFATPFPFASFNTSHVTLYHDTGIHCCT